MKLKEIFETKKKNQRLYQTSCPVIGLTGGIATGKSSVSKKMTELGIGVICADKLVKGIYQREEAFNFIKESFPSAVNDQGINFKKLREIAFNSEKDKKRLEEFIYERLPDAFSQEYSKLENKEVLVYDVPLLFEKKLEDNFDLIICVYTSKDEQVKRVMQRDSITKELAEKIISNQMPIGEKKERADFAIDNEKDLMHLDLEIEALCTILFE